jgi:hypothetical protein
LILFQYVMFRMLATKYIAAAETMKKKKSQRPGSLAPAPFPSHHQPSASRQNKIAVGCCCCWGPPPRCRVVSCGSLRKSSSSARFLYRPSASVSVAIGIPRRGTTIPSPKKRHDVESPRASLFVRRSACLSLHPYIIYKVLTKKNNQTTIT